MKTAFLHLHNREFNDIPYYRSRSVHVVVVFLNFTYSQTLCVQTVKYFSRLHGLTDSPEPPLVAYTTGTFSYGLAQLQFWLYFLLWNSLSLSEERTPYCSCIEQLLIFYFLIFDLIVNLLVILTLCLLRLSSADIFLSKSTFSKNAFRNTFRVSNSLDPDQARQNVGPDLGANCLQRLSADDIGRLSAKNVAMP